VELSPTGDKEENISLIINSVRKILRCKDLEVFVPAISQKVRGESQTMFYMDGYIFVHYRPDIQYTRLCETTYFQDVLRSSSARDGIKYSLLNDKDLNPMRVGMNDIQCGEFRLNDKVRIVKGCFKNLIGCVSLVYDDKKKVQVFVNLRSKKVLLDYPVTYVEKILREP
jgi:transcription antitermination factor NusG